MVNVWAGSLLLLLKLFLGMFSDTLVLKASCALVVKFPPYLAFMNFLFLALNFIAILIRDINSVFIFLHFR